MSGEEERKKREEQTERGKYENNEKVSRKKSAVNQDSLSSITCVVAAPLMVRP